MAISHVNDSQRYEVVKKNMFAVMFLGLVMGCAIENRGPVEGAGTSDQTEQEVTQEVSQEARLTTEATAVSSSVDQNCLRACLQDCGAVCPAGSGKPACIAECAQENKECRASCQRP